MKRTLIAITALAVVGGGVWVKASTTPGVSADITSVTDGDTVRLETEGGRKLKVRLACIDAPEGNVEGIGGAAASRLEEMTPVSSTIRFVELGSGGWGRRAGELYSGRWPFYTNATASWLPRASPLSIRSTSASAIGLITGGTRSWLACSVVVSRAMGTSAIPGIAGGAIALTATSVA